MNIVERVARAICREHGYGCIPPNGSDERIDRDWPMFTGQAKAAIQALIDNEWPENPSPQNYIHDDCVDYAKSVLSAMLEGSDG